MRTPYKNQFNFPLEKYIERNHYYSENNFNLKECKEILEGESIPLNQLNDGTEDSFSFKFINNRIFLTNNSFIIPCSSIIDRGKNLNPLIIVYYIPTENTKLYFNPYYFEEQSIQLMYDIMFFVRIMEFLNEKKSITNFLDNLNHFLIKHGDYQSTLIIRLIEDKCSNIEERFELYERYDSLGFFSILILGYFGKIKLEWNRLLNLFNNDNNRFNLNFNFSVNTLKIDSYNEFMVYFKEKFTSLKEFCDFFELDYFLDNIYRFKPNLENKPYHIISVIDDGITNINFPTIEEFRNQKLFGSYTVLYNRSKLTNKINFNSRLYKHTSKEEKLPHNFVKSYCKRIGEKLRIIENEYRTEKGYDIVGSLVNESILYNKIKNKYKEHLVVSQGSPSWLKKQRIDIFFPNLNIGIEYQGIQHFEPIQFFGGEEGYVKSIERDKRKRYLCKRNGCHLIEVLPNYNIEDVFERIDNLIQQS